jgi:hypothetical protein
LIAEISRLASYGVDVAEHVTPLRFRQPSCFALGMVFSPVVQYASAFVLHFRLRQRLIVAWNPRRFRQRHPVRDWRADWHGKYSIRIQKPRHGIKIAAFSALPPVVDEHEYFAVFLRKPFGK